MILCALSWLYLNLPFFVYFLKRYERGIKSIVFSNKRIIDPTLNASLPENQVITEFAFGKVQEANYEGIDQTEPIWPVSMHVFQYQVNYYNT